MFIYIQTSAVTIWLFNEWSIFIDFFGKNRGFGSISIAVNRLLWSVMLKSSGDVGDDC